MSGVMSRSSSPSDSSATESGSASDTLSLAQRLREITKNNNGYQFIQQNGQRIFAPGSHLHIPPPQRGSEVFVGNIPKNMFEDELIPLFQMAGKLLQFRLMLNFQNETRGYGFATYFNPNHVSRAIGMFHRYRTKNGIRLTVCKSLDNRRLFFGNIPKDKTRDEVLATWKKNFSGVTDVIMYQDWEDPAKNRGFAFVEFESHNDASVLRRQLYPKNLFVWEHVIYVDWAEPETDVDPDVMAKVRVLYVKNLPYEWSQQQSQAFFVSCLGSDMIERTHKINTFAFVHCKSRKSAEDARRALKGLKVWNRIIDVEWARPRHTIARALPSQNINSVPRRNRGPAIREVQNARVNVPDTTDSVSASLSPLTPSTSNYFKMQRWSNES